MKVIPFIGSANKLFIKPIQDPDKVIIGADGTTPATSPTKGEVVAVTSEDVYGKPPKLEVGAVVYIKGFFNPRKLELEGQETLLIIREDELHAIYVKEPIITV